jgi:hypothetical protein
VTENERLRQGPAPWWHRPAQPASEHIGTLIPALLDDTPGPGAALTHTLATARTAAPAGNATYVGRTPNAAMPASRHPVNPGPTSGPPLRGQTGARRLAAGPRADGVPPCGAR